MTHTFRANGKLLLSSEYFILDGAVGLALPTRFGQTLTVETSAEKGIFWKSQDYENKVWFEAQFSESLEIVAASNNETAKTLQQILRASQISNPQFQITTSLDFPNNWGLGSSSTLISLLSQWIGVEPYGLLAATFGGSGYDIACATAKQAITFRKTQILSAPEVQAVDFNPPFRHQLYFVYLGKKQNSREGIRHYKSLPIDKADYIEQLTDITYKMAGAIDLDEFAFYMRLHENLIADVLQLPKVKDLYFDDFPGSVKSLGAWGGDFVLVACDESPELITQYFVNKGFPTVLDFDTMIL